MARLITPFVDDTDVLRAAPQQAFLTGVASSSAALAGDNLRLEAANTVHFNLSAEPFYIYADTVSSTGAYTETHTAYTAVSNGVTPCALFTSLTMEPGTVIRLYANVLTGGKTTIGNKVDDLYAMQFFINYGSDVPVGNEFVYSMQSCNTTNNLSTDNDLIEYQSHLLSCTYIHENTDTLVGSALKIKLQSSSNTLRILRYNLVMLCSKH